ncbi:MAG: hypothetical protein SVT56_06570 [Chloroflexota bacterium]|jgi:hypothetical protein|nr:hypothetical protein [Chloroflexota bacterium]
MRIVKVLIILSFVLFLTACRSEVFTADNLPWVGDKPVLFKDSFSDSMGNWRTHSDSLSFAGYTQSGFRLWANVPNYQFWSVPGLNFKNVLIYTRAYKQAGPDNNIYGVVCRYQSEDNYYALVIGSDGYYGIFRTLEGEQALINQEHMDFSEAIHRGGGTNEIQAVCKGNQLILIVNDTVLLQAQDNSLTHGDVGLIIGNFSEPGVDVLFDDFIVVTP